MANTLTFKIFFFSFPDFNISLPPVSYTHLDVYKRQLLVRPHYVCLDVAVRCVWLATVRLFQLVVLK